MAAFNLSAHELCDLRMLAWGAYSPLDGFLRHDDYMGVVERMQLTSGALWPLPITLSPPDHLIVPLKHAHEIELHLPDGGFLAFLREPELYQVDVHQEARCVYGTEDPGHPGVARLFQGGTWRLGGRVEALFPNRLRLAPPFDTRPSTPNEVRHAIAGKGWKTVVAFQTRNPIHRAHEYLTKVALEGIDGLLIHPLVGETKGDDVPAAVRLRCYEVLIDKYYPADRVLLALFPAPMRYAGPREAVFHALVRANYGATHFIVGRDHAGVGNYYEPMAAQRLLCSLDLRALGIIPVPFDNAFYCAECGQMATAKTCPHPISSRVELSGTKVRQQLASGVLPPVEYSRREVAQLLIEAYRTASSNGQVAAAGVAAAQ
jgi:sulfate adenylyltransferase